MSRVPLLPEIHAQAILPAFDVASLKPVQPQPPYAIDLGNSAHGKVTLTNVTLRECLKFAFHIDNDSRIAGPEWIESRTDLFTIVGQGPPDTPREQLRLMMQVLLTERFGLELHHEQRELAYLALVPDKKGLKVQASKNGADASSANVRAGKIVANVTLPTLALFLARFTGSAVVDMTDLKGAYDVHLEWAWETLSTPKGETGADTSAGPSVYAAVQEQLGLRLEARKGPFDVVVIDRANSAPLGN